MGYIKPIISFITENVKLILVILLAIAVVFAFSYRDKYKQQQHKTQQQINNIEALQDSVSEYRTVNDKLGFQTLAFQTTANQLQTLSDSLSKELEEEKGNVKVITKYKTVTKTDTIYIDSSIEANGNTYTISFDDKKVYTGGYYKIGGYTQFSWDTVATEPYNAQTVITDNEIGMDVVTGVREKDGKYYIFVRTDYPNVQFGNIEGALLDMEELKNNKPSRWGIGIATGYGYSDGFSPFIGIGVTYDIITF